MYQAWTPGWYPFEVFPSAEPVLFLQVPPLGHLRPGTADAGVGLVDALQDRAALVGAGVVEHPGRLDERVDLRAGRRVGDRRPAHVTLVQGTGHSDRRERCAAVGRLVDAVAVRAGTPADDCVDDVAVGAGLDGDVGDECVVRDPARLRAGARQRSDAFSQYRSPGIREGRRCGRVPVEALARCRQDRSVGLDEPTDRVIVQLVAADAREGGAAVTRVENADAGVRIAARIRLAGADPEAVARIDREGSDGERRGIVGQRRPRAPGELPDAAVGSARVDRGSVDGERRHAPTDVAGTAAGVRPDRIAVALRVAVVGLVRDLAPGAGGDRQVLGRQIGAAEGAGIDRVGRRRARFAVLVGLLEHVEGALACVLQGAFG